MTLKKTVAITITAAVLVATGAYAKGNMDNPGMGNNKQQEKQQRFANKNTPAAFEAYDANKDGVISAAEFESAKEARMKNNAQEGKMLRNAGNSPQFSDMDKDGDGKITKEELHLGQQARANQNQKKMRPQP